MTCVLSVSYSFMVNWEAKGYLEPSRGFRQGDPISPYLFMLCVEGLLALISQNERNGVFHGIHIDDTALSLHHLLFADDNLFFTRATMEDCGVVQHILDIYSQALGQAINFHKSNVAFSSNMEIAVHVRLASFLGVQ